MAGDRFVDAFETTNHKRHLFRKFLKHIPEMLEIAADEELRLLRRDIESRLCRLNRIWDFLHVWLETADRFANRRKEAGTVNLRFYQGADQAVFNRPPVQPRKQRHLRGVAKVLLAVFHLSSRFFDPLRIGIRQLLEDGKMTDRFVELEILLRRHRSGAHFTETLEIV